MKGKYREKERRESVVGECYMVVGMQKKRRVWIQSMVGRGEKWGGGDEREREKKAWLS